MEERIRERGNISSPQDFEDQVTIEGDLGTSLSILVGNKWEAVGNYDKALENYLCCINYGDAKRLIKEKNFPKGKLEEINERAASRMDAYSNAMTKHFLNEEKKEQAKAWYRNQAKMIRERDFGGDIY